MATRNTSTFTLTLPSERETSAFDAQSKVGWKEREAKGGEALR